MKTFNKNRGVALIQVLILSAILSVIAIQFSLTSRNQVAIAQDFNSRLEAEVLLRTYKSKVLYTLFKYDSSQLSDKNVDGIKWNLRNQPIKMSESVELKIQALAGKLSLITTPEHYWEKLLTSLNVPQEQHSTIIQSLIDWIDVNEQSLLDGAEQSSYVGTLKGLPRNGPMQHISELQFVNGITLKLYNQLLPLVTHYPVGSFNPALAPPDLINALFPNDIATLIIQEQELASFTENSWLQIAGGQSTDFIDLHPKSTFSVNITVKYNDVVLSETIDVKVESQKPETPIIILAVY